MTEARRLGCLAAITLAAACCWLQAYAATPAPAVASDLAPFDAPVEPPDPTLEPPTPAEPEGPLALRDALALALLHNPELQGFSWEVRASEARRLQASKLPNPELELRFYHFDDEGDPEAEESRRRVIVSQTLELGGQRGRRVELAELERDVASWDYEAQRIDVATAVASRFVAVLGAQNRVSAWSEMVRFSEQMLETMRALVEGGEVRRVEVHEATRQTGLARIELRRAEAELATARFALAASWGGLAPRFTEAVGDLEQVRSVPDLETVLQLAQRSPQTGRAEAELGRSHAALELAKSSRVPDLTLGGGVRWEETFDQRDYLVDVAIDLPIFDRNQGAVREARYDVARAQAARRASASESAQLLATAYHAWIEADARRTTLEREVLPAARAAFEAFRAGFANETATVGDLLDSRRDLARAEADHAEALIDYHQAAAALEEIGGRSLE